MTTTIILNGRTFPSRYAHLITEPGDYPPLWEGFAWHEAGHAVLGLAEGLRLDFVESHKDWRGGRTRFAAEDLPKVSKVIYAAGERAADRWLRETGQWTPVNAMRVETGASSDRDHYTWEDAHDVADEALDRHWGAVSAVADALAVERHLKRADIEEIVGSMDTKVIIT